MAAKFASSKFRHTKGSLGKRELWYTELSTSVTSDANTIAVSSTTLAFTQSTSGGGDIGLLPLSATGKRKAINVDVIHAHSGRQVYDIQWNPTNETTLGTCGDDGTVCIWNVKGASAPSSAAQSLQAHKRRAEVLRFHPTASGIVASGSLDKSAILWDIEAGKDVQTLSHNGGVEGLSWNYDGSLLASSGADKTIRVWDARANQCTTSGSAHPGVKAQRVVWLTGLDRLFTTGLSKFREREFSIWDPRDLSKPLKNNKIDSSTGTLGAVYDHDTNMVFLCGKGDAVVRAYEMRDDKNFYTELQSVSSSKGFTSIGLLPKKAVDVMECEVNRLFGVQNDCIIPMTYVVPRKSHVDFASDLFPDTHSGEASLSAQQWLSGENAAPKLDSLEPKKFEEYREEKKAEAVRKEEEKKKDVYIPKVVTGIVRKTNYRHTEGKEDWKKTWYTNVKADCSTRDATPIIANDKYFAVPWSGPGGRIAAIPLSRQGKLPDTGQFGMIETGSPVLDFQFHPHDSHLMVTGNENAHAMIWKVTDDIIDLKDDRKRATNYVGPPEVDLKGHYSKVTFTSFHPTAKDVLVTSSADGTVKLWDVSVGDEKNTLEGVIEDFVQCVDWSYDGSLMMMSTHDRKIKLVDPRANKVVQEGLAHTGALGVKLAWLGNTPRIMTTGFGPGSERELGLWDTRKLAEPLAPYFAVDQAQALLTPHYDPDHGIAFLFAKGDGTISYFEITDDAPYFHYLNKYPTNVPQMGVAVLPKSMCDFKKVQICRMLKLTTDSVIPITFTVPRTKKQFYQDDIYSDTWDLKPSMTASEWFGGASKPRNLVSRQPAGMELLSNAPKEEKVAKYKFDPNAPKKEGSTSYLGSYYDKMVKIKTEGGAAAQDEKERLRIEQMNVADEDMDYDDDDWD